MSRRPYTRRGRAPGDALSSTEAARALGDVVDRAQSISQPGVEDTAEVATDVRRVLEDVPESQLQGSEELANAIDNVRGEMRGLPFPDNIDPAKNRLLLGPLDSLRRAAAGTGLVADHFENFRDGVDQLRREAGLPVTGATTQDAIEMFRQPVEDAHQVDVDDKSEAEVAEEMQRLARCARQGRTLGEHLRMLEDAIDAGDFEEVASLTAHVTYHMGRLGECGETFDHNRVADAAQSLLVSMERGDEMGAMSALDRLRTMVE